MPILLTSVQEAAFNAAAEAAASLPLPERNGWSSRLQLFFYPNGHVSAGGPHPHRKNENIYSKNMPTAAEAVRDLLDKIDVAQNEPLKLQTAKEAIDAANAIVDEYRAGGEGDHALLDEVADRLAALPVA